MSTAWAASPSELLMRAATKAAGRRRSLARRRLTLIVGLVLLGIAIAAAALAPVLASQSPTAIDPLHPLAAPLSSGHLLGTDQYGQDVLAARALGYTSFRVMFRHILPNMASAVIIFSMVAAVGNIILAASLGFLGLGAQPPSPEWGAMISDGQNYILTSWWLATIPGLAVVFVGIAFSLVGDGLADLLRAGER